MKTNLIAYGLATLFVVSVFLFEVRRSQLAAHHVRSVYCGRVLADFVATNPAYLSFEPVTNFTPQGIQITNRAVTNYYWKIWPIFKSP